jgi:predicted dehydrogenase
VSGKSIRVAVIGVGEFGRNHVRVWRELANSAELAGAVELAGVVDENEERAKAVAAEFGTRAIRDLYAVAAERIDAVSLAVPTKDHARVGCMLLDAGMDVLVEKPMASTLAEADGLMASAKRSNRILQVGHVERFNPAVAAAQKIVARPLFFEVHRLGVFTPRSLDIDVVYDVMIHDLDILLSFVDAPVEDLRSVGIPVITDKIDIAHARVQFANGTVANVTASRVSTERVRKMRFFQQHEYISLDFARRDALRIRVESSSAAQPEIGFEKLPTMEEEPLHAELRSFLESVRTRRAPLVDGFAGRRALQLADRVMAGILDHARRVQLGDATPQAIR